MVTRDPHNSFHKMLRWIYRIVKDNNIAAVYWPVRHDVIPQAASSVTKFVHQQIIADEQSILHGLRRNLKRLDNECNYEDRNYNRRQKQLQWAGPFTSWVVEDYIHAVNYDDLTCSPVAKGHFQLDDARYSSTCRAASCSAYFLVEPSARATNSFCPCCPKACIFASTVKVLLCSGPRCLTKV